MGYIMNARPIRLRLKKKKIIYKSNNGFSKKKKKGPIMKDGG